MSTTKRSTVAGNAKRISELEQEVADLTAQLLTAQNSTSQQNSTPQTSPAVSDNTPITKLTKYLHDMHLLNSKKLRPSTFKKRYSDFSETGEL